MNTDTDEQIMNETDDANDNNTINITFDEDVYKEDKLKEKMTLILSLAGNNSCVECGEAEPQWASASLGVTICIGCSGIHRNLGVHISRVKSLFLDNWKKEELEALRDTGNIKSKAQWESSVPPFFQKPKPADSVMLKEQFIRAKYERKEFSANKSSCFSLDKHGLVCKEGFLTKKGIVVKNWKKRHHVLQGTLLQYFKKPKDAAPAGVVSLKDASNIDCCQNIDNKSFCFVITTPNREFYASADNAKEMYDWVQALRAAKEQLCAVRDQGNKASAIDIKDVKSKIVTSIELKKHLVNKKAVNNCFPGNTAVDWLLVTYNLTSRNEGCDICTKLMQEGLITLVSGEAGFHDDANSLYTFKT